MVLESVVDNDDFVESSDCTFGQIEGIFSHADVECKVGISCPNEGAFFFIALMWGREVEEWFEGRIEI